MNSKPLGILFTGSLFLYCYNTPLAQAQIVPDSTLPASSKVNINNKTSVITGGTQVGSNLFHSFQEFSVPLNTEAYFNNPLTVENIFSRVTGRNVSNINGLILANGTANLFLLNPNGIIFGPNAALNIGGSFMASTADRLVFNDGSSFSATNPETPPLLNVNVPIGLQFGPNPGNIINQSVATVNEQTVGLQVQPGKTLALIGGNVNFKGGLIVSPGTHVELGGLTGIGTVQLNADGSLSFPDGVARGDVLLTDGTGINVRANGGGSVTINSRNLDILQGSTIRAGIAAEVGATQTPAGDIKIDATKAVTIRNTDSLIENAVLSESRGNVGNIYITANSLTVSEGGQIYASLVGQGTVGDINLNVKEAAFFEGFGNAPNYTLSGVYNQIEGDGVGEGGDINLIADSLLVSRGARLQASVIGEGTAGRINLNIRETAAFDGVAVGSERNVSSGTYSRVDNYESVGQTGGINLIARSLLVTDGAVITASTAGIGNGGDITISVRDQIILDDIGVVPLTETGIEQSSGIYSSAKFTGIGIGGNIRIKTGSLSITKGAVVISNAYGKGSGGNIEIKADTVYLEGFDKTGYSSGILAPTERTATGRGGEITLNVGTLQILNGAVITARTSSLAEGGNITINAERLEAKGGGQVLTTTFRGGNAGNITVNVSDQILLSGQDPTHTQRLIISNFDEGVVNTSGPNSGILANTSQGSTGSGGTVNLRANSLIIQNNGEVSVSAEGTGAAGNLNIDASAIYLSSGNITAQTSAGNFGNINIQADEIQLRRNSSITTDASNLATGGNITSNTETLAALENSDISANAQQGRGGQVRINAAGIFGTKFRSEPTSLSDITATSDLGAEFNGIVELNLSEVNLNAGLFNISEEFVDAENLIVQGCEPNQNNSRFVNTGTGGMPPTPNEMLANQAFWEDLRPLMPGEKASSVNISDQISARVPVILAEAQGWVKNPDGTIILTTTPPVSTSHESWQRTFGCEGKPL